METVGEVIKYLVFAMLLLPYSFLVAKLITIAVVHTLEESVAEKENKEWLNANRESE
jgi:hypothetical protein